MEGSISSSCGEKEYAETLPIGWRFKPTAKELIVHYLKKKIEGKNLPYNRIREVELYGFATPEKLTENYKLIRETEWYFFTPRNKKYLNGDRPDRGTPGGYWKPTEADKPILSKGITLGFKKTLCFYEGKATKGTKTNWIMHEYRVQRTNPITTDTMKLDDCVLCKVYKRNVREKKANNGSTTQNQRVNSDQGRGNQQQHQRADHHQAPDNANQQHQMITHQVPAEIADHEGLLLPFHQGTFMHNNATVGFKNGYDHLIHPQMFQPQMVRPQPFYALENSQQDMPSDADFANGASRMP